MVTGKALFAWIGLTFLFAAVGALGSSDAARLYAQLQQPAWAPPGWLFGPVWSALYLLMAIAAWRYWGKSSGARDRGVCLYFAQLTLNSLWSWLFFAWYLGQLAFLCIVVLWLLIAATVYVFGKRDLVAAVLLLPYLGWVSFAAFLCHSMWKLNTGILN